MTSNKTADFKSSLQFDFLDTPTNKVLGAENYGDFQKRLRESNCQRCPELLEGRTHIVVDRGNPAAQIVAIGEAPGENEDEQGKAFVGRAGQLLDKIMESVGINTNKDMLIVNVVKCRPPANRPPKPQEAVSCLPYLHWQLKKVNPKLIILLGATAAKHLVPNIKEGGMRERVGQFFDSADFPGVKFLILYHPAYLLRDPRKKVEMWEHVKLLRKWLDETKTAAIPGAACLAGRQAGE